MRQGEEAVEHDGDYEHLLSAYAVGEDAADSPADDHAEQTPGGKRPHQGAWIGVIRPKRVCDEHVCRVDDHEVVAIENHCKGKQHEHEPGVFVHSKGVDNFGNGVFLIIHVPLLIR